MGDEGLADQQGRAMPTSAVRTVAEQRLATATPKATTQLPRKQPTVLTPQATERTAERAENCELPPTSVQRLLARNRSRSRGSQRESGNSTERPENLASMSASLGNLPAGPA